MKIAVACESGQVAQHFGRCPEYRLFEVQDGRIARQTELRSPGHEPGMLPRLLASQGATCVIAGGMGPSAAGLFRENNIDIITGASGKIEDVVQAYLDGSLKLSVSSCEHHEDGGKHGEV